METGVPRDSVLPILGGHNHVDRHENWYSLLLDTGACPIPGTIGDRLRLQRLGDVVGNRWRRFFRDQHH